ncbi:RDD family protein [Symbioplanes lichenis]|uniref:RDD family protein n=1 Tax=Symbioplanes lichenis TaxID=1629072 RepID=UPI00273A0CE2|nr:RDD family protein [Actinoplanes lichenis]
MPYPTGASLPFVRAAAGDRIVAALLDFLLVVLTLGIGWMIWSLVTWQQGQSPAKSMLGLTVVDAATGRPYGMGQMFVREFLVRGLLFGAGAALTCELLTVADVVTLFREDARTLHDQVAGSAVAARQ